MSRSLREVIPSVLEKALSDPDAWVPEGLVAGCE